MIQLLLFHNMTMWVSQGTKNKSSFLSEHIMDMLNARE